MSIVLRATKTASTYRRSGADRTETLNLSDLSCTPMYAADTMMLNQMLQLGQINTIYNTYQTFVVGVHDIKQGDSLEVDGERYIVLGASEWAITNVQPVMRLIVEHVRL